MTDDLWKALSEESGKDVKKLMDPWVWKTGYPVISVTEKPGSGSIQLEQHRFLATGDVGIVDDLTLWTCPLNIRTEQGVVEAVLEDRSGSYNVPEDFFMINSDHTGFYRTLYSEDRLEKLAAAAVEGKLTVVDRAGLVADTGALAAAGYTTTSSLLSLISTFRGEKEFGVWQAMLSVITSLQESWTFDDDSVSEWSFIFSGCSTGRRLTPS